MDQSSFVFETLDDLLRSTIETIIHHGDRITATKGSNLELSGVLLELSDPKARLSRTETRGKPFSCLGELFWYLSGSNSLGNISYYLPHYKEYSEDGLIPGGYGPRLFGEGDGNQVKNVIGLLKRKRSSRQGVIQLFSAADIAKPSKDVPCTCVLQFMIRRDTLNMVTYMRSNDLYLGLPHDIFCFTMLQELVARSLDAALGTYKHMVGSLHLYEENIDDAHDFINEGWQSTTAPMPDMPIGDPWPAIEALRDIEAKLRGGVTVEVVENSALDPYWADLARLLTVFRHFKDSARDKIVDVRAQMSSPIFDTFIDQKLRELH